MARRAANWSLALVVILTIATAASACSKNDNPVTTNAAGTTAAPGTTSGTVAASAGGTVPGTSTSQPAGTTSTTASSPASSSVTSSTTSGSPTSPPAGDAAKFCARWKQADDEFSNASPTDTGVLTRIKATFVELVVLAPPAIHDDVQTLSNAVNQMNDMNSPPPTDAQTTAASDRIESWINSNCGYDPKNPNQPPTTGPPSSKFAPVGPAIQ